jgi:hypothetical protein
MGLPNPYSHFVSCLSSWGACHINDWITGGQVKHA